MSRPEDDTEPKYLGLTAAQFNLGFFAVLAVIAVIVWQTVLDGATSLDEIEQAVSTQNEPARSALQEITEVPAFVEASCRFVLPDQFRKVQCGYLVVQEDRSHPDGRTVRLYVAIIKTDSDTPAPDPIVYLSGGPGGSAVLPLSQSFALFEPLLADRDLIIVDQRGVGYSEPSLSCSEVNEVVERSLRERLTVAEESDLTLNALGACHDRLTGKSINLASYNSAESAADIDDLREVLGYKEWSLLGVSYGTRLALTIMRDFPEGVRSVILDSTYPPEVDLYAEQPGNLMRSLRLLFDGCAADPSCNALFPNLENVFFAEVRRLNENPATVDFIHPGTLERLRGVPVDGTALLSLMYQALYVTDAIPLLPLAIYAMRESDYTFFADTYQSYLRDYGDFSDAMHFAVQCTEEAPFGDPGALAAANEKYAQLSSLFGGDGGATALEVCQSWGPGTPKPIENQPVKSDIPTLILAGEYDPITPPAWGQLVSENLNNSYYFEFPDHAHGVALDGGCPLDVTLAFLRDPSTKPSADC